MPGSLTDEIQFQNVWGEKSPELIMEIVDTWKALRVLPEGVDPALRAREVVFVVRNKENKIIGISTAYVVWIEQLKNHLFAFRGMIDPSYRIPGLFIKLTLTTINFLESIHKELTPLPIGVIAEIENPHLQRIRDTVTVTGLTFIGYSPRGNPLKVYYFKGAKY